MGVEGKSARTEGDHWDVVTGVGYTALGVAALRAAATARPEPLAPDPYARFFVEASGDPHFIAMLASAPRESRRFPLFEIMGVQARFFDDFCLTASQAGARQVVILASGLDSRPYRLKWPANTTIFELDQPKVLEFKTKVMTEHGVYPTTDHHPVAADLRGNWQAELRNAGFDPTRTTTWTVEGLLPYLPGAAQDALFEQIHIMSALGSHLGFNASFTPEDVAEARRIGSANSYSNPLGNIDIGDLFYGDERTEPTRWLQERGWQVHSVVPKNLAAQYERIVPDNADDFTHFLAQAKLHTATC